MIETRMIEDVLTQHLGQGKRLVLHSGVCEPVHLAQMVVEEASRWPGTTMETLMSPGPGCYVDGTRIDVEAVVPGAAMRRAVAQGQVRRICASLFQQAQAYDTGRLRADVLMLQVTPPDENGMVSLGPCIGYMPQILKQDTLVVASVNPQIPRSGVKIPLDRLDHVVEFDAPLPSTSLSPVDSVDQQIADNVLTLLRDGITVEVGIGSTPDAVMQSLSCLNNIQVHTGMLNQAVMVPVGSGAVVGKITTTMAMGDAPFYRWLDEGDRVDFRPIMHTHARQTIADKPGFFAINGALQVDQLGNVNVETIAGRPISCPGGLPDFATAAQQSMGGASLIVLRSTAGRHQVSTIVSQLDQKTLDGSHVDYVVTEHGIAHLKNNSADGRRQAMESVMHPDHRN